MALPQRPQAIRHALALRLLGPPPLLWRLSGWRPVVLWRAPEAEQWPRSLRSWLALAALVPQQLHWWTLRPLLQSWRRRALRARAFQATPSQPAPPEQDQPPAPLPRRLALAACWANRFGIPPTYVPKAVGVGLGSRSLDRPNLLRISLAAAAETSGAQGGAQQQTLLLQQAQIDDASAEDLAFLAEALRQGGALEVFSQSIAMKKGRSGTLLTALAEPETAETLRAVWWRHSTSLGLREQLQQRWRLPRRIVQLQTHLGEVRLKQAQRPDGSWRGKPEHDDLINLAQRHQLSIEAVRQQVIQAQHQQHQQTGPEDELTQ
jgi:hypothetical protein